MENTNGDEGVAIGDSNTRPEGAAFDENIARPEATLSAEEFHRLQEQLLELRNRNYELIEENKRQQTYINALPSKGIETLNFASKLMGRRRDKEGTNEKLEYEIHVLRSKLSSQEEEFRLQQSTLLSELNKVISRCEFLEKELKEKDGKDAFKTFSPDSPSIAVSTGNEMNENGFLQEENDALKEEICRLKDVIAEKDDVIEGIEKLKKDLEVATSEYDRQISEAKKQLGDISAKLEDSQRCNDDLETSLRAKNEEIALLNASLREKQQNAEAEQADAALIQSLQKTIDKLKAGRDELERAHADEVTNKSKLVDEVTTLKASLQHAEVNWKKSLDQLRCERDKLRTENEELSKQSADIESRGKELEEKLVEISALQHKLEGANAALEMTNKSKEEAVMQVSDLQCKLRSAVEEKEALERSKEEECKLLNEQLSAKQDKIEELARMNEAEIFVVTSELKSVNSDLEAKVKEQEERLKTKDEEMKVALKKQSSMVRELRRQVLQEKKRAEQAERQLDEVLGGGRHFRVVGPPLSSEQARGSAEPASSVCSWAFIADSDANSVHTLDGEESSCSASVLESDNAELITRLALLQKKHSETMDHLNMVEEENVLLRKEVSEKNELIAEWIRSRPANTESQPSSSSPSMRLRRVFDMVRVDESAADIRDMNRRLQRMLEETLSKNLLLQKDLELLLEKNNK